MTTISDITITTDGSTPPANIEVTVRCTIDTTKGTVPQAFFPAQGMGVNMTNTPGTTTWTASDTQMYDVGDYTVTISCDDVDADKTFSL